MAVSEITSQTIRKTNARDSAAKLMPTRLKRITDWHAVGLSVVSLCVIAAFFYSVSTRVTFPYQLDYGEGIVLWQAQHVSNLSSAYASINHYPYIVFHYTPLFHLTALAASKFTGDLLVAGRLVSAISCFGICTTLGWIAYFVAPKRVTRLSALSGALLAAACPLCLIALLFWTPLMRVDLLGLWFTLAGLSVFILAQSSAQRYFAFALFVAAMYTRQSLIAAAATCLLVGAIMNLRQAIKMLAFTAALGSAIMEILYVATSGEVIKHLFLYNVNRFSISSVISGFSFNIASIAPILPLAVFAVRAPLREVANAIAHRKWAALRIRLVKSRYRLAVFTIATYFCFSCLVSFTAGKSGSSLNYFLEMDLGVCALASLVMARRLWWRRSRGSTSRSKSEIVLSALFVGFPALMVSALLYFDHRTHESRIIGARNSAILVSILSHNPEPLMSEDMTLLYRADKHLPFEPAIVSELAAVHLWDETPLINLINNRRFSVMVIGTGSDSVRRYSPGVMKAIRENYKPTETFAEFDENVSVYIPLARVLAFPTAKAGTSGAATSDAH